MSLRFPLQEPSTAPLQHEKAQKKGEEEEMASIGDPAPDFSLPDLINGGTFTLSQHAGKVILLFFGNYG